MDKKEFNTLVDNSGLTKIEVGKILGVGRGTVYNYLKGETIPETKVDFIREVLSKDENTLKRMLNNDSGLTVDNTIEFVISNFNEFMERPSFRSKIFREAFNIAAEVITQEKDKLTK